MSHAPFLRSDPPMRKQPIVTGYKKSLKMRGKKATVRLTALVYLLGVVIVCSFVGLLESDGIKESGNHSGKPLQDAP